ncbi:MAG: 4-(cytidine 5'-diphospho)-2-C-methyl-D-erythritol kinase, partial [Massilibacteroides sp.]|nr:4-(cytidine 5'-diphospho)-2-C-methyl-D-erythritol kinase [Massilibacteroides sp.]
LVKPDLAVSTAEAYSLIKPAFPERSLKEIISLPILEWQEFLVNDFEKSVFPRYPEIAQIKEMLYASGAVYAAMSGSGSSVFGLFEKRVSLEKHFPGCFVWEGEL